MYSISFDWIVDLTPCLKKPFTSIDIFSQKEDMRKQIQCFTKISNSCPNSSWLYFASSSEKDDQTIHNRGP